MCCERYGNMTVQEIMQNKGVKPSSLRVMIYNYLCDNRTHPTVDEIYSGLSPLIPTLSKTTVYNTVKLLAQKDIIKAVGIEGFRTRYDANTEFHGHFLCRECSRVYDVFLGGCPECPLKDFTVSAKDVFYTGRCKACSDKNTKNITNRKEELS